MAAAHQDTDNADNCTNNGNTDKDTKNRVRGHRSEHITCHIGDSGNEGCGIRTTLRPKHICWGCLK